MTDDLPRRRPDLLIPVLALVLIFLLAARTPLDTDLWWHLAAGRQTWQTGQPMVADVFSYSRIGETWINHSWLSEWLLYGIYQIGGYFGLGFGVAGLATLSMGFVFAQMRGAAIFRAFLLILATTVAAVVWSPRPQMVSLVLFALVGWVLYRLKWQKKDQLWLLPVIFLAWSNLHGGWSLGFMWIGLMIAGEIANHILKNPAAEVLSYPQLRRLVFWTLVSGLVLVIHPNGFAILKIPFQTVEVQVLQQFIQEWSSPDFHELYQQPFLWMILALLAAFGLSGRKVDATDLLTVGFFGALGLIARRNFGPFALTAAPVLSRYLWAAFRAWRGRPVEGAAGWGPGPQEPLPARRRPAWQKAVNLGLVAVLGLAALGKLAVVTFPAFVEANSAQANPVGAVQYLKETQAYGRIFNEYNWGGYLDWNAPELKVFVDGRTDLFGDEILGEWIQIVQAGPGWQERLDHWKPDWILIDPNRPLRPLLTKGWTEVYRDDHSVLFRSSATP